MQWVIIGLLLCFGQIQGAGLESLIKKYKPKAVIAVGSDLDSLAQSIAPLLSESGKVYLVDLYAHTHATNIISVPLIESEAISAFRGVRADLIYLQGELALPNLEAWYSLVRGWGILCGDKENGTVGELASLERVEVKKMGKIWYYKEPSTKPYPIGFSIPESKIVRTIPPKERDFATAVPGDPNTYIFKEEDEYNEDYQRSYFGVTRRKGGWDCLRHYEILANGCIPYFVDLDSCDPNTLYFFPKELIQEAMRLPGVSYLKIDHELFDIAQYEEMLEKLLDYTRKHLTTKAMAQYLLETLNYSGCGKVLFLTGHSGVDYLQFLIGGGLKELLRGNLIDAARLDPIYTDYVIVDRGYLYGRGINYTKVVEDCLTDRENIEERIKNREFELVIYSAVHRSLPFYDLVLQTYPAEKIAYLCGEDWHPCGYAHLKNFFIREYDAALPQIRMFPDPDNLNLKPIGNPCD